VLQYDVLSCSVLQYHLAHPWCIEASMRVCVCERERKRQREREREWEREDERGKREKRLREG